jgi:hypothetical protein
MKELYLVYDFETPNGLLPFSYNMNTLGELLKKSLNEGIFLKKKYDNHKKIKTADLQNHIMESDNNIFIIPIPKKVGDEIILENVLSKKLLEYVNRYSSFQIIYVNG